MCQAVIEVENNYLMVKVNGDLILNCSSELKEKIKTATDTSQKYHLIVDLSEVSFIDSSGLGVLIAWFKHVNQAQGKIVFANMTEYVQKIVSLAKLDKIFTLTHSIDEAKALF